MLLIDPRTALVLAHERADHLRDDAFFAPRHCASSLRRALAACLRTTANRLDPSLLVHRTA